MIHRLAVKCHIIEREFTCSAHEEYHEEKEHQPGEFQRLIRGQQTFRAVNEKDRPDQYGNLNQRGDSRQETDGQQQATDEVRQDHVMKKRAMSEPGVSRA